MTQFSKFRWFQKTATAIFIIFFSIMFAVIITAYSRQSGSTGLDMAKIQKLRSTDKEVIDPQGVLKN